MSNLRSSRTVFPQGSKSRVRALLQERGRQSIWSGSRLGRSKLLQDIKCHTEGVESEQKQKDKVYNKNITHFRQAFFARDSHILPFLSSLRKNKEQSNKRLGVTSLEPFQVSLKETANQKVRKNVNDMFANPFRLSKINYRWNGRSGLGVKTGCEFECTLRLSKDVRNPEESKFENRVEPIRYRTVQQRKYELKELVCERQRKLFTLAN